MKLALMQPYFFPYLGYFQLINSVDRFILFDDAQYRQRGWINRNRIMKPDEGHQHIRMPIAKHGSKAPIKDIKTVEQQSWKGRILRQLRHYEKRAPFYSQVYRLVSDCFEFSELNVAKLNAHYLRVICEYLQVDFRTELSSTMGLDYSCIAGPGDWGWSVCEQLGADEYVNPLGGAALFERCKFEERGIKLTFIEPKLKDYDQGRSCFEPNLSIIDVLMFNSDAGVSAMLRDFELR